MIPFGEWLPDQSDFQNPGSTVATNVIPAARGYRPFFGLSEVSQAADNRIRGIYATKDTNDTIFIFVGDSGKLYKMNNGTFALADVKSGTYSLSGDEQWRFVRFGDDVIASGSDSDVLQKFTIGTSSAFSAISGAPAAKFLAVVRDFVVTANVTYSSATYRSRVRWSQINDANSWTLGTAQADFQEIADAGHITGLVGGEFGVVLLEKAIARMQYVGSPLIFTFEKVETGHGCNYPNSVTSLGPTQVFYLADDGFFFFDGSKSIPIGAEKVDKFFFDSINFKFADRLSSTIDPENQIVMWSYADRESTGEPNKILVYNYAVQKWSLINLEHEFLGNSLTPNMTLEGLDNLSSSLDSLTTSLDSNFYAGGFFQLSASKDKKLQTLTGAQLDAVLETSEFETAPMRQSLIKGVTPYVTARDVAPTLSVQVGSRSRQIDKTTFTTASSINDDNSCPVRTHGRYHRVRVNASGTWRYALGVDVDAVTLGRR